MASQGNSPLDTEQILTVLLEGEIELQGLMPWSSNYTFLVSLASAQDHLKLLGIYKPCQGERPSLGFSRWNPMPARIYQLSNQPSAGLAQHSPDRFTRRPAWPGIGSAFY